MAIDGRTDRAQPFWVAVLALFTAGLSASLRAAVAGDLKHLYLDPIDIGRSGAMIGEALGLAFLGFSIMLAVCSALLDRIGIKRMLMFAAAAFVGASLLLVSCGSLPAGPLVYRWICAAMFLSGLAWGGVEGSVNPMIAYLYPEGATSRMNLLHAWWPAGQIAGGLLGVFAGQAGLDWRLTFSVVPLIATGLGIVVLRVEFPRSPSAKAGLSSRAQFGEIFRRPSFFIWFVLMLMTAASELAPGQWVDVALTHVVGMRGILLLVYVSAIQFIGRHFAGPLAHRLSAEGLLCLSSALACLGLYMLGSAHSPVSAIVAATAWGLGVCYLWPTMVATAAERYPRGGAWVIGLMGVAGSLSTYFVLPLLGSVYDFAENRAAGGAEALARLPAEKLQAVLVYAAGQSFKAVAIIPAVLIVAFGILWLRRPNTAPIHRGAGGEAPSAL
jgi:MFS family permease